MTDASEKIKHEELKEILEILLGKITALEERLKRVLLMMAEAIAEIKDAVIHV